MSAIGTNTEIKAHLFANLMNKEQLADALGISARTLDRWYSQRKGPARIKQGKLILYRLEAVEKWLQSSESKSLR
jgi:predicted DNA-binding transcriptional regulator AlpA